MPAEAPLVSIVTPSFNQGRYLEATIGSVLSQDYRRIEYIIQDAGSTDETPAVLDRYRRSARVFVEADAGQADAIRRGFARASGRFLAWLNSDDLLHPGAVAAAVEALVRRPFCPLVYGHADFIDPGGRRVARCAHVEPFNRHRLRHYSDLIVQPAAFFRKDAYDAVGGVDPSLHYAMDYDLWLKLTRTADAHLLPLVMASYRWFGGNKSAVGGYDRLEEVDRVVRRHGISATPAFFVLERCNLDAGRVSEEWRQGNRASAIAGVGRIVRTLAKHPRAVAAAMSPDVWRVVRTGRLLRRVDSTPGRTGTGRPT